MSNLHAGKRKIILSKNKKFLNDRISGVVVRKKETTRAEDTPAFSETFLVGNLADLLFEIKCLARAYVSAKSTRIKQASIAKLIGILGRYHHLLGNHFRKIIAEFIKETFKDMHVPRQNFKKIEAWWLRM